MYCCDLCGKEIEYKPFELCLFGSGDVYTHKACSECRDEYEYTCECMSPEEINELELGDE